MTLKTNHIRRVSTPAHVWTEDAEKGDAAMCGAEWSRSFGTLVALPNAGLGDSLFEALEHEEMCTLCKHEVIEHHNLPTRLKSDAMSVKELAQSYLSAVEQSDGGEG